MVAETEHGEVETVEAETVEQDDTPAQSTAVTSYRETGELAPVAAGGLTPMVMLDRALASGQGIEIIDKLMDLQERWEQNLGRKAFDNAMADAKASIPPIVKNREVDYTSSKGRTNYKHEDLAGIARVVDPILAAHGLSYRYRTEVEDGLIWVTCVMSHRDGHSEETRLPASRDESGGKNTIQALGSAVTYLQRYTLKAALGLSSAHDDDAAKADEREEDRAPLSEDRVKHIRDELEALGAEEAAFCEYLRVPNLMEMPAGRFSDACEALAAKRRHAEKAKAKAEAEATAAKGSAEGDQQ